MLLCNFFVAHLHKKNFTQRFIRCKGTIVLLLQLLSTSKGEKQNEISKSNKIEWTVLVLATSRFTNMLV